MANSKGPSGIRNLMYTGKNSLLPPKSPFPSLPTSYVDYAPNPTIGPKGVPKSREGNSHHQRTNSESFLVEEQPSWLDDLLNEPETPVRRGGHRRSSSDSFAYIDAANVANLDHVAQDDNRFKNIMPSPSWGSQDLVNYKDMRHASFYMDANSSGRLKNRAWDRSLSSTGHLHGLPSPIDNNLQSMVPSAASQEADKGLSAGAEKQDPTESGSNESNSSSERKDSSHAKLPETDTKRAKQQYAQRSRVRKLQYIAELERNVQALQVEGSEVSAELEFLNQQNLILSLENKALKQRLENLAQEQLIKYLEQEVLERERGRLRALYQQQQPQQQQRPSSTHRRSSSRDLDQQFSALTLKHKDATSGHEPVSGQFRNENIYS